MFAAYKGDDMLAGVVMYENKEVVHAQYVANSSQGWDFGAEDLIFDFGISNEKSGKYTRAKSSTTA